MVYSLWIYNDGKTVSAEILKKARKVTDRVGCLKGILKIFKVLHYSEINISIW